ncbi:MAG: hypothetical protein AMXMBFR47_03350 [Planctomycetota bacterium]
MTVQTMCDHCGAQFRVKAEHVGKRAKCKACGESFVIAPLPDPENLESTAITDSHESSADSDGPPDYMTGFEAVKKELIARFGPDDGKVIFSPVPLYVDPENGLAESLTFRDYVEGVAYCTCALSLYPQQRPGPGGNYELMMCSRKPADFMPGVIGNLARYTFESVLKPGDTMDLGPEQPKGSTIRGLLCLEPEARDLPFRIFGRECTVLLLMGITKAEMESCMELGSEGVTLKLKRDGVFPFTTMDRRSVV